MSSGKVVYVAIEFGTTYSGYVPYDKRKKTLKLFLRHPLVFSLTNGSASIHSVWKPKKHMPSYPGLVNRPLGISLSCLNLVFTIRRWVHANFTVTTVFIWPY